MYICMAVTTKAPEVSLGPTFLSKFSKVPINIHLIWFQIKTLYLKGSKTHVHINVNNVTIKLRIWNTLVLH